MRVYARLEGTHYHTTKKYLMLKGKEFDRTGYREISWSEVRERKLRPCACVKER